MVVHVKFSWSLNSSNVGKETSLTVSLIQALTF